LAILEVLAQSGCDFDAVSVGELARLLTLGVAPSRIIVSGVGKRDDEIATALEAGIMGFNVESEGELEAIDSVAARVGRRARVGIRVNPDVDPRTHPYIATGLAESKFGIPMSRALGAYRRALALRGLDVVGVDCHIGSQLTDLAPLAEAFARLRAFTLEVRALGAPLEYVDVGGGIGIAYREGQAAPTLEAYARTVLEAVGDLGLTIVVEPGRSLVGEAGVLLTQVLFTKAKAGGSGATEFVVVDAAMNDLIRPSLYQAHHEILPVAEPPQGARPVTADVVGPVCESADFLARARPLPPLARGALVAVLSAGAYAFAMASNYNARPRAAEVLVHGRDFSV
ncbi:MAG TPA: diaminopimelate decarboxylase, partial [Methylomirabilota bacterium]|nr:diaminopimelate decarboxylase [Methylomirabilota bacterium]